jgi:hypothetical protein
VARNCAVAPGCTPAASCASSAPAAGARGYCAPSHAPSCRLAPLCGLIDSPSCLEVVAFKRTTANQPSSGAECGGRSGAARAAGMLQSVQVARCVPSTKHTTPGGFVNSGTHFARDAISARAACARRKQACTCRKKQHVLLASSAGSGWLLTAGSLRPVPCVPQTSKKGRRMQQLATCSVTVSDMPAS